MEKGIIQNFQFYENEKLFKNGKYLTISLDFVRFSPCIMCMQYRGGVFSTVLNTPYGTHDIPHVHHDIPHGTEHPPWYSR